MDLRDKSGKYIGRILNSSNGDQRLYDSVGAYKGYYDPNANTTYNKSGIYYGSGNLLTMLLTEA